jgi:hypothetical protein
MDEQRWETEVRRRCPRGDALERLDAALVLSGEIQAGADGLVDRFVHEARQEGHSWTAIGQRLGVSKQAARKRFVEPLPSPGRPTPRLVRCLETARAEAAAAGSPEVGTDQLLLGLFTEGIAATKLQELAITVDAAREAGGRLFPGAGELGTAAPVESAETRSCLEQAAAMAVRAGSRYVGTEHVLMAIVLDAGSRGRRVLQAMGADLAAVKRELACFVEPGRSRRRRRGKVGATGGRCSFCGREAGDADSVAGSRGGRICRDCVRLCDEILAAG